MIVDRGFKWVKGRARRNEEIDLGSIGCVFLCGFAWSGAAMCLRFAQAGGQGPLGDVRGGVRRHEKQWEDMT